MKTGKAGYSLFEVLVAFAILTTVLAVLIPGQAGLLARVGQQDEGFLARDYAYSRLAAHGVTRNITPGNRVGTYRDWQVLEEVSELIPEGTDTPVWSVVIEVQSQTGKRLARVETLKGPE